MPAPKPDCLLETVFDVVVDQRLLGLRNGLLDCMQVLGTSRHGRCISIISMMLRR
jgi:hypothetical protein